MGRMRKTDKGRLREGRGQGFGASYIPWLLPREVPSRGRCHELWGWKYPRIYYMLSDGECWHFVRYQMEDNIIDIREQFPLLSLSETLEIAKEFGISHPPRYKKDEKEKTVMTSDFDLLVKKGSGVQELVRAVKTEEDYQKPRTQEKLFIEKTYWQRRGIDWGVVLHTEETQVIGSNIYNIYQDYFWNDDKGFSLIEIEWLVYRFKDILMQCNMDVLKTIEIFEKKMEWIKGEGLNFFKYLLTHKIIKTDFTTKFNYFEMKVWF